MARFENVKVDPWLQDQRDYNEYKKIPNDAVFVCTYYVFMNPIDIVESAYFRRTKEQDELWIAQRDNELYGDLSDCSIKDQFDSFGCAVVAPSQGDKVSSSKGLVTHLFRSRTGFASPSGFIKSGILAESEYKGVIEGLKRELDYYSQEAHANKSEIVDVAQKLGLSPEPTGSGPHGWSAGCPGTNHPLFISTESNTYGCGWCRRKGGPEELRAFVEERRSKKIHISDTNEELDFKMDAHLTHEEIANWRRDLHRIPELSFELHQTSQYVKQRLDELHIPYYTSAKTGIVALVEGACPGPTIALRADMDALEIKEETNLPFASTNNCMHACGHDAHMAILLGAAKIITGHKDKLKGNVKLIFQPAEEAEGGARPMIQEGCLDNPKVDAILGLHIGQLFPEVGLGQIGVGIGPVMAAVSAFSVRVKGKSAHAATPHLGIDAITTASEMVLAIQKIISRELSPTNPATISITQINGGKTFNAICDEAVFKGDFRTVNKEDELFIKKRIKEVCLSIAKSNRGDVDVEFLGSFPATINDEPLTKKFIKSTGKILGEEDIIEIKKPSLGNDDMAYFLEKVPGIYFFLGSHHPEKGIDYPHHHPKFDIEEGFMWVGVAVFVQAVFDYCEGSYE